MLLASPPAKHSIPIALQTVNGGCSCGGTHVVQFYEGDAFLTRTVAEFLAPAFKSGGRGLVIATAEHLAAMERALDAIGLDAAALQARGRYVTLEAKATLRQISSAEGQIDEALFERVVGDLARSLTSDGGELRAFGEMVALLWGEGKPEQALRLEDCWNRLLGRQRFELFCAYPMSLFTRSESARRFMHVCRAHTRVLPTESYAPQEGLSDPQLRQIAVLQQRAAVLEAEIEERRRAEEKLRRREAELTSFVETASIGLHWVDAQGIIIWANRAELEMLGYTYEEYVGHPVAEFHVDQAVIDDILTRLQRAERIQDYEAQLRCKDGNIKTVLIDSHALQDGGRFVHSQCFMRDVTEQRRSEQATRHLAAIVEGSDDAILSKNLDGIVTSWNPAAERMFGYRADEVVGRSITLLIPTDRLGEEQMILTRLRRGERIDHYETLRRRKDGRLLEVSLTISPVRDAAGRIVGASKIVRDVTEKKAASRALQEAHAQLERELEVRRATAEELRLTNERFNLAAHSDTLTLFEQDAELRYTWVYPSRPETATLIGRTDESVVGAETAAMLNRLKRAVLTTGEMERAQVKVDGQEGVRYFDVTVSPRRDREGKLVGVVGAAFEVTNQKRAELALIEAKDELAAMNHQLEMRVQERTASLTELLAQMETFSYTVSHDLRAPLRAMSEYSRVLLEDHGDVLAGEPRRYVERILRASERMNRLTSDVLAYARVSRERLELGAVSLADCLQQVIHHTVELQPPRATIVVPAVMPPVVGSETLLTLVLANLLGNAVKFVPSGRKPELQIECRRENGFVRVDVVDNGIGIRPEHQSRLFGLFERLHLEREYDGTGIGLAIVRRAVERMGGAVGVESDGTNGSRFWFKLRAID